MRSGRWKEPPRSTTFAADMGGDGVHRAIPGGMPAQHPRQHASDRGVLPGRREAIILLVVPLCLQHGSSRNRPDVIALKESDAYPAMAERGYGWEEAESPRCSARSTGGARPRDAHRAFPQHLRATGTWSAPGEGARGDVSQGVIEAQDTGDLRIQIWGDGARRGASATSAIAWSGSTDHALRGADRDLPINSVQRLVRSTTGVRSSRRSRA